ncbi:MAG TPA: caspase family protein, partial [Bacteroidia bacterium]|nr:caspase family protein [Bacteroidia bacterium]
VKRIAHKLISIKHKEVELLEPYDDNEFNTISVNFEQFLERIRNELCVPKNMLRLSMNVKEQDIKMIYIPWTLKLARQK